MRVGALEETITVTGETPVVDVQTTQRETVLSADIVAAIPGNRSVGTLLNAVPGLTVNDGALAASPTMTFFAARGGPINEGRMAINGMTIAAPFNGGGVSTYILDSINVDEVVGGRRRRPRRVGHRRAGDEPGAAIRRQRVPRLGVHQQRGRLVARQQPERRAARAVGPNHRKRPASSTPTTRASRTAARSSAIDSGSLAAIAAWRRRRRCRASSYNANAFDASRWDWVADPTRHGADAAGTRSRTSGGSRPRSPPNIASPTTRSTSAAARDRR